MKILAAVIVVSLLVMAMFVFVGPDDEPRIDDNDFQGNDQDDGQDDENEPQDETPVDNGPDDTVALDEPEPVEPEPNPAEPDSEPEPEPVPEPIPVPEPPIPQKEADTWTALYYVAYDNSIGQWDMWGSALHHIQQVGPPINGSIVAMVDLVEDGDCRIVDIYKGSHTERPISIVNSSWGDEVNTGHPGPLEEYIRWGMETYPADRYSLHLMDHGGGWMGICLDDSSDSDLVLGWELADLLRNVTEDKGKKLDIIQCDACFMANLEIAYELWESADYWIGGAMVAVAETDEEGYYNSNWNYHDIWAGLQENPYWTPEEFARHFVACSNAIGPYAYPSMGQNHLEYSDTFSAMNLSKIPALVLALEEMAVEIYTNVTNTGETLAERQLIDVVIGYPESQPELNTESYSGSPELAGLSFWPMYDLGDLANRL
ncbi:MAG: hypothetical protein KAT70_06020, partial [Thermoplasmata archaeon]|nr:hypothetical protein [Thermoplasmata archaeon]